MRMIRRAALAVLASAALSGSVTIAEANDRTAFAGCVAERTDKSIVLNTSGGERIEIDTTWLKPTMRDALSEDCLTVTTQMVDGRYVAESVEAGDEPNEVQGLSNGDSDDRETRGQAEEREEKEDDD